MIHTVVFTGVISSRLTDPAEMRKTSSEEAEYSQNIQQNDNQGTLLSNSRP